MKYGQDLSYRAREFLMKDAYSFHENEDCLNKTYNLFFEAYKKCFNKIGFEYKVVNADNGQIGGSEFIRISCDSRKWRR